MILSLAVSLLSPMSLDVRGEVRSAYISRGKVIEDRPMQMNLIRTGCDTGSFGRLGFWAWTVSSLTGSRQDVHQRAFCETDPGVFWNYGWKLDDAGEWRLVTEVLKDWILLNGYTEDYHARGADDPIDEWRIGNSLENPFATPYWLMRRGINEYDWAYFQVGLRKRFQLMSMLSLVVDYQIDMGNRRHLTLRYGAFEDGSGYSDGIQSSNLRITLGWEISDWIEAFAGVHQFDLLASKARDACADHNACCGNADLTVWTVGCRMTF